MNGLAVSVQAVGLLGQGLPGWEAARPVLAGAAAYRAGPVELPAPARLSAAERRRAIPSVRLALAVGEAAVAAADVDPAGLPAVFASSGADGETIHAILSALATPEREVSPTRFHNSVHNAASGYWGLAMQSHAPATSLSAYDASFSAGLLEAAVQAEAAEGPVLLVAYDLPYPHPLDKVRPISTQFGVALVLCRAASARAVARLEIAVADGPESTCADAGLDAVRRGNPAARSLPLLAALAAPDGQVVRIALRHGALEVAVRPGGAASC
jgi:hypothetical protein